MAISKAYYAALGEFVDVFASAEDGLFIALCATAGVDSKIGAAVFSGAAVGGSISFIRRLHETRGAVVPKRLDDALKQLSAITTTRNAILHYGAREHADGSIHITDELRTHTFDRANPFPISPEVLGVMTEDLRTIIVVMYIFSANTTSPETYAASGGPTLRALESHARRPLLYKPAQPNTKGQQSQRASRKRQPQRKPSQG